MSAVPDARYAASAAPVPPQINSALRSIGGPVLAAVGLVLIAVGLVLGVIVGVVIGILTGLIPFDLC